MDFELGRFPVVRVVYSFAAATSEAIRLGIVVRNANDLASDRFASRIIRSVVEALSAVVFHVPELEGVERLIHEVVASNSSLSRKAMERGERALLDRLLGSETARPLGC